MRMKLCFCLVLSFFVVCDMASLKGRIKDLRNKNKGNTNSNLDIGEPLNEIDFYNANLLSGRGITDFTLPGHGGPHFTSRFRHGERYKVVLNFTVTDESARFRNFSAVFFFRSLPLIRKCRYGAIGLFEGDIAGVNASDLAFEARNAIVDLNVRWPLGEIPYVISSSFDSFERSTIAKAINEYHSRTCLRFLPRKGQNDYIRIVKGNGCSSSVGRQGGEQEVSLGGGCGYFGIIIHELMHAAGFWHEQSRADRDDHVSIVWNNIIRGMEYNFQKYSWKVIQNMGEQYDLGSVMHYDGYAFSSRRGQPTIVAKGTSRQQAMGQRRGFSDTDLRKINKLYKCGDIGGTGTGGEVVTVVTPKGDCKDGHKRCVEWSKRGECIVNPSWMNVNCLNACDVCETIGGECKDLNLKCNTWATTGECIYNPSYMNNFCKASCKRCEKSG